MSTSHSQTKPRRLSRALYRAALDALIRSKGLGRFAFFGTTVEGRIYPNGMDETSGQVLDDRGRAFYFWTAWDTERGEPTFRIWEPVADLTSWVDSTSYRRAREAVGLTD